MQVTYCLSTWSKLKGLIAKPYLDEGEYYVFASCTAIHTFGMRFELDVIFCNKAGDIVKYCRQVAPNRIVFVTNAFFAIEFISDRLLNEEQLKAIVENCLRVNQSKQCSFRWI